MSQKNGAKGPEHGAIKAESEPIIRERYSRGFVQLIPTRKPSWLEKKARKA